jgi:hypothetical protein
MPSANQINAILPDVILFNVIVLSTKYHYIKKAVYLSAILLTVITPNAMRNMAFFLSVILSPDILFNVHSSECYSEKCQVPSS